MRQSRLEHAFGLEDGVSIGPATDLFLKSMGRGDFSQKRTSPALDFKSASTLPRPLRCVHVMCRMHSDANAFGHAMFGKEILGSLGPVMPSYIPFEYSQL